MNTWKKEIRFVRAEGFYHGAQGATSDAAKAELDAHFRQTREKIQSDGIRPLKWLEAKIMTLTRRKADAENRWRTLEAETKGMAPEFAMPIVAILLAVLAVGGEVVLLAPVMDGFGIADPLWQLFTALVLVLVSSGLLELSIRQLRPGGQDDQGSGATVPKDSDHYKAFTVITTVLLTVFAFTLVFVLGWWRAEEMIFASILQQGEWGSFLKENATLTRVCVVLLTLGLPIFAAIAFDWSFARLRDAWEWRKARRQFQKLSRRLDVNQKRLEAKTEKTNCLLAALEEQRQEWVSAYLENYDLGKIVGARKQPLWQVLVKIAAVTLLILVSCLLLDPLLARYVDSGRPLIYLLAALGFGGLYAYRASKAWDRPTPLELYRQRAINWRMEEVPYGSDEVRPVATEKTGIKAPAKKDLVLRSRPPSIHQSEEGNTAP